MEIYDNTLKQAQYIDLTHAFSPTIPVWPGFGHAQFLPAVAGAAIPGEVEKGQEFTYIKDGFVASAYDLPTDQYGTQLDPPAHWDEYDATISDLPATFDVPAVGWVGRTERDRYPPDAFKKTRFH